MQCEQCRGSGIRNEPHQVETAPVCPCCDGTGVIPDESDLPTIQEMAGILAYEIDPQSWLLVDEPREEDYEVCPTCLNEEEYSVGCPTCGGTGYV